MKFTSFDVTHFKQELMHTVDLMLNLLAKKSVKFIDDQKNGGTQSILAYRLFKFGKNFSLSACVICIQTKAKKD